MDKNFLYGIGTLKINNIAVGYIEKDSFDFGGKPGETVDINAEQVPEAPVLNLKQKNGTIAPTFNLIQLDVTNLQKTMGGTVNEDEWSAPSDLINIEAPVVIETRSGGIITIPRASVNANLEGKLSLTETAKIKVTLTVLKPTNNEAPYKIDYTEAG